MLHENAHGRNKFTYCIWKLIAGKSVSTRGANGSVEKAADGLGIAGSTALRRHSADTRRHSEPRCRSADWLAVRRCVARGQDLLRLGRFSWL